MSFYVEDTGGSSTFKPVPAGMHLARCYRIIDLGTQKSTWEGTEKFLRKVMIGWELHGEAEDGTPLKTDKGDPMATFRNYTLSWGENASLRKDLQSWRGVPFTEEEIRRFNLETVLDAWCMLTIIQKPGTNGKIYSNVASISPVPKIIKQQGYPTPFNKKQLFRLADPDFALFDTFSQGLKTKIENSPEWRALKNAPKPSAAPQKSGFDDLDDDIPF